MQLVILVQGAGHMTRESAASGSGSGSGCTPGAASQSRGRRPSSTPGSSDPGSGTPGRARTFDVNPTSIRKAARLCAPLLSKPDFKEMKSHCLLAPSSTFSATVHEAAGTTKYDFPAQQGWSKRARQHRHGHCFRSHRHRQGPTSTEQFFKDRPIPAEDLCLQGGSWPPCWEREGAGAT